MTLRPANDTRPFAPVRVDAGAALSARAPQGRLHLGDRRLLVPRHPARRVATLIIVMAVMNGFRKELFNKILGARRPRGRLKIGTDDFADYDETWPSACEASPGVKHAVPLIEGQVIASTPAQALGGLGARPGRGWTRSALPLIARQRPRRHAGRLRQAGRHRHRHAAGPAPARQRWATASRWCRRAGRRPPFGTGAARQSPTRSWRSSRWACRSTTAA